MYNIDKEIHVKLKS